MVVPEVESLRLSKPFGGSSQHPRSSPSHLPLASSPYHSYLYHQRLQHEQRMLGLNPHIGSGHPFQSMFPGLHAANISAAAAALASANNNLPPPPPPPPPPAPTSTPSSLPSPIVAIGIILVVVVVIVVVMIIISIIGIVRASAGSPCGSATACATRSTHAVVTT